MSIGLDVRSRKAVGSLIGIGFLLMILAVGFSYYEVVNRIERSSDGILREMASLDRAAADEDLEIQRVRLTGSNSLNLTIKNTGDILAELEWIGIFDDTSNTQDYYRVSESLNPTEIQTEIGNSTIVMNPLNEYTIQVLTKLGNIYYGEYPEPVVTGGGSGSGGETQFFYVDNIVDSQPPTAIGTHSLFSAMQAGPDGIMDVLTEGLVSGADVNTTLINVESFEGVWPPVGWAETGNWNQESLRANTGTNSADFDGQGGGASGDLDTVAVDCSGTSAIYIDFYYYDENMDLGELLFYMWDGASWDLISDLTQDAEDVWNHYQLKVTDAQYFDATFKIRWSAVGLGGPEHGYIDDVTIIKEIVASDYYDLDLEVSWSGLPSKANEWLSIYGGTLGAETIKVDYWDGGAWVNELPSLSPGWNNMDVSGILGSSSFIIRFVDTTGVGDVTQNSYEIDSVYLNLWD